MKKFSKKQLVLAAAVAANALVGVAHADNKKPVARKGADPVGLCYGVVGPGEGECAGKNPETGETWSCAGSNPTADLGWKKLKKSECDAAPKHKDATQKRFELVK